MKNNKPELIGKLNIPKLHMHKYERYLPTAFDESLSILEKINKIIHFLYEYSKITQEMLDRWNEVYEWVMGDGLEQAVNDKLTEWLEDGTLSQILEKLLLEEYARKDWVLEQLNKFKAEIINELEILKEQIIDYINELTVFDYKKAEPLYYTGLGVYRNAVNQSINIDDETNQIYATQANNDDGYTISRLTPSGVLISRMVIEGGGHGTLIGLDRQSNVLRIWSFHERSNRLILFEYQDDQTLSHSQVMSLPDYTPTHLRSISFNATYDKYNNNLVFAHSRKVEVMSKGNILNGIDEIMYTVNISDLDLHTGRPMQGVAVHDKELYYYTGGPSLSSLPMIANYDLETGKRKSEYVLNNIPSETGKNIFRDNFVEPEGITYYINPLTKKHSLVFAVTNGGSLKRHTNAYTLDQFDGEKHWQSLTNVGSQKYEISRSDGRAFQLLDGIKTLDDVVLPGLYFITNATYRSLPNMPYPDGGSNWWYEIKFFDQYYTRTEKIWRHSYGRKNIEFERSRDTRTNRATPWSPVFKSHATNGESAVASDWGYKLSNLTIAGTFYVTTPQSELFEDFPEEFKGKAGWWIINSEPDINNTIWQKLQRNSTAYLDTLYRTVNVETKQGGKFQRIRDRLQVYTNISLLNGATNEDSEHPLRAANDGRNIIIKGSVNVPYTNGITIGYLPENMRPTEYWNALVPTNGGYYRKVTIRPTDGRISLYNGGSPDSSPLCNIYLLVPIY